MSKTRTPFQAPAPQAAPAAPEPSQEHAPWGNAAMIEAINGGDPPAAQRERPTPESVSLVQLFPVAGIGATARMGVEPGVCVDSPFEGLSVEEHFGPSRMIPGMFSAEDLTDHPDAPRTPEAFAAALNRGEEGTFTVDCLGSFTDYHHGGGLPLQFQGWVTPAALRRGIGYEFDQTYTANGETIGTFVVRRLVGSGWVEVDKVPTGRSSIHTSGRTTLPG